MIAGDEPFDLSERFNLSVVRVGTERSPVIVVENYLSDLEGLRDQAASSAAFKPVESVRYPGNRAPMPARYNATFRRYLQRSVGEIFGFGSLDIVRSQCDFSIVTVRPENLQPVQRIPHFDGTEQGMIAGIHFLCPSSKGGTSFYRHRRTGYENITEARKYLYLRTLNEESKTMGLPPAAYINGETAQFEQVASFDAAVNRMLIYRGSILHSGNIAPDFDFDADPRTGRLTANTFYLFGRP
jgi:hypothetical protein